MNYRIKTFGIARDILGGREVEIKIEGNTVQALRTHLLAHYPALAELRSLFIAVNQAYSEDHQVLQETDEIALIPPVSGG